MIERWQNSLSLNRGNTSINFAHSGCKQMSTVHLKTNIPTSHLQVFLCGDSAEAKQAVRELATRLGLSVLDRGSLSAAREVEDFPLQLFPEWRLPLCIATGLTAFFFFYLLIRDIIYAYVEQDKDISFRIMVSLANKVETSKPHQDQKALRSS